MLCTFCVTFCKDALIEDILSGCAVFSVSRFAKTHWWRTFFQTTLCSLCHVLQRNLDREHSFRLCCVLSAMFCKDALIENIQTKLCTLCHVLQRRINREHSFRLCCVLCVTFCRDALIENILSDHAVFSLSRFAKTQAMPENEWFQSVLIRRLDEANASSFAVTITTSPASLSWTLTVMLTRIRRRGPGNS